MGAAARAHVAERPDAGSASVQRDCSTLYGCKLIGLRRERRQVRVQGAHRRAAGDRPRTPRRRRSAARTSGCALLGPVAEYDRQADDVREGGGGFWARRYARKHDVPNGLRTFAVPLLPILREDQDPEHAARAADRPDRPAAAARSSSAQRARTRRAPTTRSSTPSTTTRGSQGRAHFADGARRALHGHRPRALLEQDQAQRRAARPSARPRTRRRRELTRHALGPDAQLRRRPAAPRATCPKETVKRGREPHDGQAQRHDRRSPTPTRSRRSGCCSS